MPFKSNAARRHYIPKQRRKVTNWGEYDASLRQRGSLTDWLTDGAIAASVAVLNLTIVRINPAFGGYRLAIESKRRFPMRRGPR